MNNPKVLVGAPTAGMYEYCLQQYLDGFKALTYKNADLMIVDNSEEDSYLKKLQSLQVDAVRIPWAEKVRQRIVDARNVLRKKVLDEGYDYFLSLEQDIVPPPDIIERLLSHEKQVVTGVYYKEFNINLTHKGEVVKRTKKVMPMVYSFVPGVKDKMIMLSAEEVAGDKLMQIRAAGLGCMLIHRDVLEKIAFRFDESEAVKGCYDDVFFCADAAKHKIPIFVDTSVKCMHLTRGKDKGVFKDS